MKIELKDDYFSIEWDEGYFVSHNASRSIKCQFNKKSKEYKRIQIGCDLLNESVVFFDNFLKLLKKQHD